MHAKQDAALDGQPAIKAKSASFAWEREVGPVLHSICLEASKGQLVMVVGAVGSGKSSLITALLGELHARGGSVEVITNPHSHDASWTSARWLLLILGKISLTLLGQVHA